MEERRFMPVATLSDPASLQLRRREIWLRRILVVFAVVAALIVAADFGLVMWAENGLSGAEIVVGGQSMMFAHTGRLYYDLKEYPYTVCAYTPILYLLEAGLYKLGLPVYVAGRMVNFCALLGIFYISWQLLLLYTRERSYAFLGTVMCASSALLLSWGTIGQTDTLAVFWAIAAFYNYSRYAVRGESTLGWAAGLAVLAFFTKQTMVACPVAIVILLWFEQRSMAVRFACGVASVVACVSLGINAALDGRFIRDTVIGNLNPLSWHKLLDHLHYLLWVAGPLFVVAAAGAKRVLRTTGRGLFVYLGIAAAVFFATSPKVGSDLNYQIETTVLLIVCACLALHSLNFLPSLFAGSKGWVTLLQLPVAVFLVVNYRVSARDMLVRFSGEQSTRAELAEIRPYFTGPGRVLSADYNALVRVQGRIEFEMLIYKFLVDAGVIDPTPVERDIARGAFSSIVLFQDVERDKTDLPIEISTLPAAQIQEVRQHYRLMKRILGTVADGVYVYQPRGAPSN